MKNGKEANCHARPTPAYPPDDAPAAAPAPAPQPAAGANCVVVPLPGTVTEVLVMVGDKVSAGQNVLKLEAMKMETTVVSKVNGSVDKLYVKPGDRVNSEDLLVSFVVEEKAEEK